MFCSDSQSAVPLFTNKATRLSLIPCKFFFFASFVSAAIAAVLASAKKLSQARAYCQKAIGFNENYGAPYILIANLYAMSPNWSDESALNKCTYFAVIDKLQRAKQVDPSVAEEANSLIGRYSGHTPQAKDLFMLGYKQGDRITIGGWIGETTTIR